MYTLPINSLLRKPTSLNGYISLLKIWRRKENNNISAICCPKQKGLIAYYMAQNFKWPDLKSIISICDQFLYIQWTSADNRSKQKFKHIKCAQKNNYYYYFFVDLKVYLLSSHFFLIHSFEVFKYSLHLKLI